MRPAHRLDSPLVSRKERHGTGAANRCVAAGFDARGRGAGGERRRVSPQGEVAQVRQVTVKFSRRPVVAVRRSAPCRSVRRRCQGAAPAGSGRWASDRVWLYDFREALPPGTSAPRSCARNGSPASPRAAAAGGAGSRPGPTEFALLHRRPGDRLDAAGRRRRDRGGPALPDPPERPGGRGERRAPTPGARSKASASGCRCASSAASCATQVLKARRIARRWPRAADRALRAAARRTARALRLVWGKGIAAAANPQVLTTIEQRFRLRVRAAFTRRVQLRARDAPKRPACRSGR